MRKKSCERAEKRRSEVCACKLESVSETGIGLPISHFRCRIWQPDDADRNANASAKCLTLSARKQFGMRMQQQQQQQHFELQSPGRLDRSIDRSIDRSMDRARASDWSPNANQVINDRHWIEITGVQRAGGAIAAVVVFPPMPSCAARVPACCPRPVFESEARSSAAGCRARSSVQVSVVVCCFFFCFFIYTKYIQFHLAVASVAVAVVVIASNFNIQMIMITWLWLRRTRHDRVSKLCAFLSACNNKPTNYD